MINNTLFTPQNYQPAQFSKTDRNGGTQNGWVQNNFQTQPNQLQQILQLLLPLLQQLVENLGSNYCNNKPIEPQPLDPIQFDADSAIPFTQVGNKQVTSIQYTGDAVLATLEDGSTFRGNIAAPGNYPTIEGQRVTQVIYDDNKAIYTLENGGEITGLKQDRILG